MSLDNQGLKQQHEAILESICTYETVQVTTDSVEYVDMIYISGLQINKTYAFTKIPTSNEYDEFWKAIWTENICYIVLFEDIHTKDKSDVKLYWPTEGKNVYGDVTVQCTTSEDHHLFNHNKFTIQFKNKSRQIEQLHFRLESDDGFYLFSLNYVNFFQKMSKIPHSCESPILVHSSSGMRGVGFVLLCDMSLRTATKDGAVDVMANLKNLTQYTSELMVDFDHYVAAHTVIADCLRYIDTTIKCNEFDVNKEKLFDKAEIQKHLHYLQDTEWLDRIKYDDDERYAQAIRPDELLPAPCTSGDADSLLKRFKIVKVYGFKTQKKFIVLYEPKGRPLCELLNLVQDESVAAIVTLNKEIFLWPNENHPVIEINRDVKLEHQMTRLLKSCDWITVKVTTATATQIVEVIYLKNLLTPIPSLPKAENFINFVHESDEIFKNVEMVLIAEGGNLTTSGLYIALTYVIQKIKTKGIYDICGSVRMLRRHSENFVVNKKHYVFLVEAAHNYLKEFSLYEKR
ncbi:receptor-type tyrosine-protein phosphatase kappa-like [Zophobas morio]|uniref:receptor-type tyrosine-protein phosphatase kappa-like n=1 Tax=Zophobas morio TaxID=2755281 RepID=UPI0030835795